MDIKSILVVFGCVWVTILVSLTSWHLLKWLVTEGLLIGAVKRLLRLTVIATLLLFCFGIYAFIGYYTLKNHGLVSVVTDAWKSEWLVSQR
jgi:hypothetical protein